jgi:ACT domain-containing protein
LNEQTEFGRANIYKTLDGYIYLMSVKNDEHQAHTIRLELVDDPGELLNALQPISENGGNLLSIFHERGNITPRGYIPVEIDLECSPERFNDIIAGLREEGINVVQAGTERYSESIIVIISGHLIDTGLSDTLTKIRKKSNTSITTLDLEAPDGTQDVSSARLELSTAMDEAEKTLEIIKEIADDKNLFVVEPHEINLSY